MSAAQLSGPPRALRSERPVAAPVEGLAVRRLGRSGAILAIGAVLTALAMAQMALDPTNVAIWEVVHWDIASATAVAAVVVGLRGTTGQVRRVGTGTAAALATWFLSNVAWTMLALDGTPVFPSVADILALLWVVPGVWMLFDSMHGRMRFAEEVAIYLDDALVFLATVAVLLAAYGPTAYFIAGIPGLLIATYPAVFLGAAVTSVVSVLATRQPLRIEGGIAFAIGTGLMGIAYSSFIIPAVNGAPMDHLAGALFSVGPLVVAYGAITWRGPVVLPPGQARLASLVGWAIGPVAVLITAASAAGVSGVAELQPILYGLTVLAASVLVVRFFLHLRERGQMVVELQRVSAENEFLIGRLQLELDELERTQQRLIDASRMTAVGELAAAIAHEVNNPLTSVLGYAELLLAGSSPDDPGHADLEVIRSEAVRVRDRVRALLDFATPRRGQPTPADLGAVVAAPLDLLRYHLARRGIALDVRAEPMPEVCVDATAIQQVLVNVVTEMAEAMPVGGGRIGVVTRPAGDRASILIEADRGDLDLERVTARFMPFAERADGEPDSQPISASLGLLRGQGATVGTRRGPSGRPQILITLGYGGLDVARPDTPLADA